MIMRCLQVVVLCLEVAKYGHAGLSSDIIHGSKEQYKIHVYIQKGSQFSITANSQICQIVHLRSDSYAIHRCRNNRYLDADGNSAVDVLYYYTFGTRTQNQQYGTTM